MRGASHLSPLHHQFDACYEQKRRLGSMYDSARHIYICPHRASIMQQMQFGRRNPQSCGTRASSILRARLLHEPKAAAHIQCVRRCYFIMCVCDPDAKVRPQKLFKFFTTTPASATRRFY